MLKKILQEIEESKRKIEKVLEEEGKLNIIMPEEIEIDEKK